MSARANPGGTARANPRGTARANTRSARANPRSSPRANSRANPRAKIPPEVADALAEPRFVRLELHTAASPERVYAAWSDPERLHRWFPHEIEGSLAPGTRSRLVWPHQSVWWDVEDAEPGRLFVFRWPWRRDEDYTTRVTVRMIPEGYGTLVRLEDGPFDLTVPGVLEAWAEASAGWGEALALLKGFLDYSVDLRR